MPARYPPAFPVGFQIPPLPARPPGVPHAHGAPRGNIPGSFLQAATSVACTIGFGMETWCASPVLMRRSMRDQWSCPYGAAHVGRTIVDRFALGQSHGVISSAS